VGAFVITTQGVFTRSAPLDSRAFDSTLVNESASDSKSLNADALVAAAADQLLVGDANDDATPAALSFESPRVDRVSSVTRMLFGASTSLFPRAAA
jgi:hypothetical protein